MYFPIITLYRLIKKGQLLVCVIYEIHANETVLPKEKKVQGRQQQAESHARKKSKHRAKCTQNKANKMISTEIQSY